MTTQCAFVTRPFVDRGIFVYFSGHPVTTTRCTSIACPFIDRHKQAIRKRAGIKVCVSPLFDQVGKLTSPVLFLPALPMPFSTNGFHRPADKENHRG